jgi:hypothetical protein
LFEGIKKLDRILILGTAETNCKAACGEGWPKAADRGHDLFCHGARLACRGAWSSCVG